MKFLSVCRTKHKARVSVELIRNRHRLFECGRRSHLAHLYFAGRHKVAFLPSLEQPQSLFQPEPRTLLNRHHGFGVAGGEGVHVGQDEVAGAVAAESGLVLFAHDGEGVQHVAGVLTGEAVEVEVEGVEAGA